MECSNCRVLESQVVSDAFAYSANELMEGGIVDHQLLRFVARSFALTRLN
jgi:hypothetical protein